MILIISSEQDEHAKAVQKCLAQEDAKVSLLDLSKFPQHLQLAMNYQNTGNHTYSIFDDKNVAIPLSEYKAIWWRRPQPFELHPQITDPAYHAFAQTECYEAFSGLWLSLDAYWINQPTQDEIAARKPFQLKIANEVGLQIPDTLITNDPEKARQFVEAHGQNTVYKAFSATKQEWRETRLLKPEELEMLPNVSFAPVIFQEYIPAEVDLRITVVGEEIFPAAIYSQEMEYKVDYRMEISQAKVTPFQLPQEVIKQLKSLMSRLGLVYGAIDMRLKPDGQFVFLEINPAGQWLFIENHTKQPMTATLAHLLSSHDK